MKGETKLCDRCKRRIRAEALSCICGWSAAGAVDLRNRVACCYAGCLENAVCRMFTKTGWANVCRSHYPNLETVPHVSHNPVIDEMRAAYQKSSYYQRMSGGKSVPETAAAALTEQPAREPGEDREELPLGIPLDDLEQQFLDKAQP